MIMNPVNPRIGRRSAMHLATTIVTVPGIKMAETIVIILALLLLAIARPHIRDLLRARLLHALKPLLLLVTMTSIIIPPRAPLFIPPNI